MNKKLMVVVVLLAVLVGGGGAWWFLRQGASSAAAPEVVAQDKFVGLDKLIVMLRPGDSVAPTYLAADLVFRTGEPDLARLKAEMPLLRSIAVQSLSALDATEARAMRIEDFQVRLGKAFATAYQREGRPAPFSAVMFGKLIIE
ncbi:flagellar basal body-associated protein FliL [Crenobacter caeni]|uniref:Flagellar basal body-associated protein FliL n=1 Tax=Crenobacter caeni TaxID=2705474 RepID=A0A6B2KRD5_9NEIS|nr:flagellar basal body-associated protein FliL [Crenobacter caeni]NDV12792.1 flagellar basal body-associated protein FliL [Crenobacter caeni]